jgi:hypothetical protein
VTKAFRSLSLFFETGDLRCFCDADHDNDLNQAIHGSGSAGEAR